MMVGGVDGRGVVRLGLPDVEAQSSSRRKLLVHLREGNWVGIGDLVVGIGNLVVGKGGIHCKT